MKTGSTYRGEVVTFRTERGFGFIRPIGGQGLPSDRDVFVHVSAIIGAGPRVLNPHDHVSFEVMETDRGMRAINVRVQFRAPDSGQ